MRAAGGQATQPFPWAIAMHAGLGLLRLSPNAFWAMTPRELAAAITDPSQTAAAPLDRARLGALMSLFPDAPAPG